MKVEEHQLDPKTRFSDRVDDYMKYRPHYPKEVLEFVRVELGLGSKHLIADIGSGTGISSEIFLDNGNKVYGVEPNEAMRKGAERLLAAYSGFRSIDGTAESTGLPDKSIDYIVAAQAFHWFEPNAARAEFLRILKDGGYVLLVWNKRLTSGSPFLEEYEKLILDFGTDYQRVRHPNVEKSDTLRPFFGKAGYKVKTFYNSQNFNLEGLLGRLTSSSYAPNKSHLRYEEMVTALNVIFEKYQRSGKIKIAYDTNIFYGKMK